MKKRMLSLALCVCLFVSLFAGLSVPASAAAAGVVRVGAQYADLTEIQHLEAVQVLTGLGVMSGFEDRTFKPAEGVTRVQMAKMISFIMNDGENVNEVYRAACPFADAKSNWGAGYIAYCAAMGIVDEGDSFRPNDAVTGIEAADMLLRALGYNAQLEGFTGNYRTTMVLNTATKAGLLKELDKNAMGQTLCRDDAAQMIFNALKAVEVEYSYDSTGAPIGKAMTVEAYGKHFDGRYDKAPLLWGEEHFIDESDSGKQLQLKNTWDSFGIECSAWFYGKDADGCMIEIAKSLPIPARYNGSLSAQQLFELTGLIAPEDTVRVYVDGAEAGDDSFRNSSSSDWREGTVINNYTAAQRITSKFYADEIDVYITEEYDGGRVVQIIGKNYYLGEVTKYVGSKNASEEAYIEIRSLSGMGGTHTYGAAAFTKADVENETKVFFTYSRPDQYIVYAERLTPVRSGAVTRISMDADGNYVLTAGGKEYICARDTETPLNIGADYDLYLSPNGKALYAEEVAVTADYYMVMKKAAVWQSGLDARMQYQVRLLGMDGKTVDLNVAAINGVSLEYNDEAFENLCTATVPTEDQDIRACAPGTIVTYTLNDKGEAKLQTASWDFDQASMDIVFNYNDLTQIATALTATSASNRTTFVLISLDKDDQYVYSTISGIAAMKAAVGNYNYYRNVTVSDRATQNDYRMTAAAAFLFVDSRTGIAIPSATLAGNTVKATILPSAKHGEQGLVAIYNAEGKMLEAAVLSKDNSPGLTASFTAGDEPVDIDEIETLDVEWHLQKTLKEPAAALKAFLHDGGFVPACRAASYPAAPQIDPRYVTVFTSLGVSGVKRLYMSDYAVSYYEVTAIENKAVKVLKVTADVYNAVIDGNQFVTASGYKMDADGFVTKITVAEGISNVEESNALGYSNGVLTIGKSEFVQDNVPVFLYDEEAEEFYSQKVSKDMSEDVRPGLFYCYNSDQTNATRSVIAIFAVANFQ